MIVENSPDHHLIEIRPMVLAVASLAQGLSPFPLKVERGGIEKDQVQPLEQMPLAVEEVFFRKVLGIVRQLHLVQNVRNDLFG